MQLEGPQTIGATALVHEAYLRLVNSEKTRPMVWENRRHFFGAAGEAMRRILIERARARNCLKRGGELSREELTISKIAAPANEDETTAISEAMEKFAEHDPECAELVRLKFFVGLDWEEIAELTGDSTRTIRRRWRFAKVWLQNAVDSQSDS